MAIQDRMDRGESAEQAETSAIRELWNVALAGDSQTASTAGSCFTFSRLATDDRLDCLYDPVPAAELQHDCGRISSTLGVECVAGKIIQDALSARGRIEAVSKTRFCRVKFPVRRGKGTVNRARKEMAKLCATCVGHDSADQNVKSRLGDGTSSATAKGLIEPYCFSKIQLPDLVPSLHVKDPDISSPLDPR
jgi:hypothetical protein